MIIVEAENQAEVGHSEWVYGWEKLSISCPEVC